MDKVWKVIKGKTIVEMQVAERDHKMNATKIRITLHDGSCLMIAIEDTSYPYDDCQSGVLTLDAYEKSDAPHNGVWRMDGEVANIKGYFKSVYGELSGRDWLLKQVSREDQLAFAQLGRSKAGHGRMGGKARAEQAQRDSRGRFMGGEG